jgi:choline dehydrogenase-like flavoprotein
LLVPYSDLDLRDEADADSSTWTHIVDVVAKRTGSVFATLGLGKETDFRALPAARLHVYAKALHESDISTIAPEFLPFRRRNLTYLLAPNSCRSVTAYVNAVACEWFFAAGPGGRGIANAVRATTRSRIQLRVKARCFVVAAGAIESARILLEIDRATGGHMVPRSAAIGRYLADHLSCPIAEVQHEDRERAARLFAPVFVRGRMRGFRFIATDDARSLPKHFSHFVFEMNNAGFMFAKDLLVGLQARTLPTVRISRAFSGIHDLLALGYHRYVTSRLHIPSDTPAHLQLDIEQHPAWENRVHLGEHTDGFGRPTAVVHWQVREIDLENIRTLAERISRRWPPSSRGFPRLVPIELTAPRGKLHDTYHPVGTCRMGTDSAAAVDMDLRVNGTANVFVLSTGVFPGAGAANPTFSMLCLGDSLAEQLADILGRSTERAAA